MLLAWLQIRRMGGRFVLRIEDIDRSRVRPGSEASILRDLAWLGFDWDEGPDVGGPYGPYRQSDCLERYAKAVSTLEGSVFRCSCTRKEIRAVAQAGEGGEIRYPGTCRSGPVHPDRACALRFRVESETLRWDDPGRGPCEEDPSQVCGDFIVRGKDGGPAYQLACVVDDIEQRITHVLRGDDIAASTGRQLLLHRAFGAAPPSFSHVALLRDSDGARLAKSRGSPPLEALREQGRDPRDILGELAASCGLLDAPAAVTPGDLVEIDP
jgi:glutamyl-tRNA synthetase